MVLPPNVGPIGHRRLAGPPLPGGGRRDPGDDRHGRLLPGRALGLETLRILVETEPRDRRPQGRPVRRVRPAGRPALPSGLGGHLGRPEAEPPGHAPVRLRRLHVHVPALQPVDRAPLLGLVVAAATSPPPAAVIERYDRPYMDRILAMPGGFDAGFHATLEVAGLAGRWRRAPYHSLTDAEYEAFCRLPACTRACWARRRSSRLQRGCTMASCTKPHCNARRPRRAVQASSDTERGDDWALIDTPALLVDLDRLEANIAAMADQSRRVGLGASATFQDPQVDRDRQAPARRRRGRDHRGEAR